MIIKELVDNNNKQLISIIEKSNWTEKEKKFQKNRLLLTSKRTLKNDRIDEQYASTVHEIKSYKLLKNFGKVEKSNDSNQTPGPDFHVDNYSIECVSCSSGKTKIERYRTNKKRKSIFCDYKDVEKLVLPRITSVLIDKKNKFDKYLNKGIVGNDEINIIWISLGDVVRDFRSDKYCFDVLKVLLGVGDYQLIFDEKSKTVKGQYCHNKEIIKENTNGEEVTADANFFLDSGNSIISAVIVSDAQITELYDNTNTFIFLNPFAQNKIKVKDFKGYVYWKANKQGEYIPRKNGKSLWREFDKKFI